MFLCAINLFNLILSSFKTEPNNENSLAFNSSSAQKRQKMELLLNLKLRESLNNSDFLLEIMNEISQEAIEKGLTPEILQSLLEDE